MTLKAVFAAVLVLAASLALSARADTVLAVLDELNALRRQHGLAPVRLEPRLMVEARSHARDMARYDYFDTRTPEGGEFGSRLDHAGYPYRRFYVQLAVGYPSAVGVVAHWSSERATRQHLLDPRFADVGLGYAEKSGGAGESRLDHFWVLTLAEPAEAFHGDWRAEMLARVNAFRAENGLPPLRPDRRLDRAAQGHADDMARRDYFAHVSPEGGSAGDRATRSGYPWHRMLENLAAGQSSPAEAVEGWKGSAGHRHAMLDPEVREVGIGYAYQPQDGGRIRAVHYWTLSLGRR